MSDPSGKTEKSFISKALGVFGWIAGAAIGSYSGINLLIPLVATGAVWWSGSKLLKDGKKEVLPTLAVNAGHFLWLSLSLFLVGAGALSSVGGDLVLYSIGLAWLLKNPSRGPLYLLGIFQIISLGINGYSLAEAAIGSMAHKALLVHVSLRALSLFFIVKLFFALKKPKPDAITT